MNVERLDCTQIGVQLLDQKIPEIFERTALVSEILEEVLDLQQVANPIVLGGVDHSLNHEVTLSLRWPSLLQVCLSLRNLVGGYMYVESMKYNPLIRKLWLKSQIVADKGQQILYGKNLVLEDLQTNIEGVVTQLFAKGGDPGDGTIVLRDNEIVKEEAVTSQDATYGYLKIGGKYSCYFGWTGAGGSLPVTVTVYKNDVLDSASWVQGADSRYLRVPIGEFDAGAEYTISYTHADFLISDAYDIAGIRQDLFEDRSLMTPEMLLSASRVHLDVAGVIRKTYTLSIADLARLSDDYEIDKLELGGIVKLITSESEDPIVATIVRLNKPNLADLRIEVDVDNVVTLLGDAWYTLKREIDDIKRGMEY